MIDKMAIYKLAAKYWFRGDSWEKSLALAKLIVYGFRFEQDK